MALTLCTPFIQLYCFLLYRSKELKKATSPQRWPNKLTNSNWDFMQGLNHEIRPLNK